MATISKPASLHFKSVRPIYRKAKARNVSPYTFKSQAYVWPGETYAFEIEVAPIRNTANAIACVTFLRDLVKADNNFTCDMSAYVPADVAQPMALRIAGNTAGWDVDTAKVFGLTFNVEQDQ